jgi:hypothetical protein
MNVMLSPFRFVAPLITALALLLPAAAADAGTAHVGPAPNLKLPGVYGGYSDFHDAVYYIAAAGERNDVTVSRGYGMQTTVITVHDDGAAVALGEGCARVDDHTARCSSGRITVIEARLGDENDELHDIRADNVVRVRGFGGAGDDLLMATGELDGGGGRDVILGGPGYDVITDGDRPGAAGELGPGPDVLDGGPGRNMIDYSQRTAPIILDLGKSARGGERNEGDAITNFDDAAGGSGDDRLTGSAGPNYLAGHRGDDKLTGLAGRDDLLGGAGRERLTGGDGNDFFDPGSGVDSFSCGHGRDSVMEPSPGEVIGACEIISFAGPDYNGASSRVSFPPHPVATSRTAVSFRIPCPKIDYDVHGRPCAGRLTVRARGGGHALLGRGRKTDKGGRWSWVRVRLTSAGRRLIRRKNGVVATMSLRGAPSAGDQLPNVGWTTRLRL